jgi:hypothetical protein
MEYFKGNMPVGKVWRKKPEAGKPRIVSIVFT